MLGRTGKLHPDPVAERRSIQISTEVTKVSLTGKAVLSSSIFNFFRNNATSRASDQLPLIFWHDLRPAQKGIMRLSLSPPNAKQRSKGFGTLATIQAMEQLATRAATP